MGLAMSIGTVAAYYDQLGKGYFAETDAYTAAYHDMRLASAESLLSGLGGSLYEFGCGSGELLQRLSRFSPRAGCDVSAEMVRMARELTGLPIAQGGVADFVRGAGRFDVIAALNVLPYLSETEEAEFLASARTRAGHVLISHTNLLFDLLTFNRFTVEFFAEHCAPALGMDGADCASAMRSLITHADAPQRQERDTLTKRRVDPFTYAPAGFEVVGARYINLHPLPPLVLDARPDLKMAALSAELPGTLARLLCSQFQLLLKPC